MMKVYTDSYLQQSTSSVIISTIILRLSPTLTTFQSRLIKYILRFKTYCPKKATYYSDETLFRGKVCFLSVHSTKKCKISIGLGPKLLLDRDRINAISVQIKFCETQLV